MHKSDSWNDLNCGRLDCLVCASAGEHEKKGKCKKRNVNYEIYCETCETTVEDEVINTVEITNGEKRKRESENEKKKINEKKEYKNVYIGESHRTSYER